MTRGDDAALSVVIAPQPGEVSCGSAERGSFDRSPAVCAGHAPLCLIKRLAQLACTFWLKQGPVLAPGRVSDREPAPTEGLRSNEPPSADVKNELAKWRQRVAHDSDAAASQAWCMTAHSA